MRKLTFTFLLIILAAAAPAQTVDSVGGTLQPPDSSFNTQQATNNDDRYCNLAQDALNHKKSWLDTGLTMMTILVALVAIVLPILVIRIERTRRELAKDLIAMRGEIDGACSAARSEMRAARGEIDAAVQRARQEVDLIVAMKKDASSQLQEVIRTSNTAKTAAEEAAKETPDISLEDKIKLIKESDAEKSVNKYEELLFLMEAEGISNDRIPASLHKNVGLNYARLERWDKAIRELKLYLDEGAKDEAALLAVAYSYDQLQRYEEALEYWHRGTDVNPQSGAAFGAWGSTLIELFDKTGDEAWLEQAFGKYERATAIDPQDDEAFSNWGIALGRMYDKTGDVKWLDQAVAKYEQAATIDQKNDSAFTDWGVVLGEMFEKTGETAWLRLAFNKYERATNLNTQNDMAYYFWGTDLVRMFKKTDEAKWLKQAFEKYEQATTLDPENHLAFSKWGSALVQMFKMTGETEWLAQAVEKYQKALQIGPELIIICSFHLAQVNALLEKKGEMLKALHETIARDKRFRQMAREDKDFEKYWNDPEFIALTKED